MAWPPPPIAADKAPGPPVDANEHPDHHNELADAINDTVTELTTGAIGTAVGNLGSAAFADAADFATGAEGDLAATAVQPGDLGTAAAANVGDFATAAQGALADSATQPADLGTAAAEDVGAFEAAGAVSTHSADTTSVHGIADTSALLTTTNSAVVTVTDTTDTLAAGDDETTIIYSNASEVTVSLANLTVGHETVLVSTGAGGLTVDANGMTILGSSPNLSIAQNEALFVKQTAASTWLVLGGTAA